MKKDLIIQKQDEIIKYYESNTELHWNETIKLDELKQELSSLKESEGEKPDWELVKSAWDLKSVLNKLVEAADILLHRKDYDGHGWEEIETCYQRGKEIVESMVKVMPEKNAAGESKLCPTCKENYLVNGLCLQCIKERKELPSYSELPVYTAPQGKRVCYDTFRNRWHIIDEKTGKEI